MHKTFACLSCEASFSIRHDLDADMYRITFCPFCGEELDAVEEYDLEDEEE
jgi:transcription elongation factor Elf1